LPSNDNDNDDHENDHGEEEEEEGEEEDDIVWRYSLNLQLYVFNGFRALDGVRIFLPAP
jgi:hypothetical protein